MSVLTLAAWWNQYADQTLFTRPELKGTHELPLSPDLPLSHPQIPHHAEQLAGAWPEWPPRYESEPSFMSAQLL